MENILRIAAAVPHLYLGNVEKNVDAHLEKLREAAEKKASLVVFPELSLTGYTCGDLFFQQSLQDRVLAGIRRLRAECPEGVVAVVGAPLRLPEGNVNAALVIRRTADREAVWFAQKTYLPNQNEFYEKRWFDSAPVPPGHSLYSGGLLFCQAAVIQCEDLTFGIELCEDLWAPLPPSNLLALKGAEVIVNLSASDELIAKREYRQELVRQQSARCLCAYLYVSAGSGESTSDLVFSGHSMAASCGSLLKENDGYLADDYLMTCDIDLDRIRADRGKQSSFRDAVQRWRDFDPRYPGLLDGQRLTLPDAEPTEIRVPKHPFIPANKAQRETRCRQIFDMQAAALARRLSITGGKVVVGISGGLDSTLALLAACKAADRLGLPRTNILGITMPCFGTSDHTYRNALTLMDTLGITSREIDIKDAVTLHLRDIGHDIADHSVTYENAQARERTQILMDVANDFGGIVLGTGDLSEIALGWCTYNADHMSMYGVNSGVPKTLVRWIIRTAADFDEFAASREVLLSILDTPISPELLPPDEQGKIAQVTEDLVGPYALHDFFLYYAVRFGYRPRKIFALCCDAFAADFSPATIRKWLINFYRRFFTQQFKRNCMPDGVKIGSVALSPRGDWRMPSDAESALWLREAEAIPDPEVKSHE